MLKQLSILAALVAFGIGAAHAQKQEAVLQHVPVPGADFDLVIASPKPGAAPLVDIGNVPDALVLHLRHGGFVVVFDDARKMIETAALLQRAPSDFHVDATPGGVLQAGVYVVPKIRGIGPGAVEISRVEAGPGPR
jgi:hypothetical protein